MTKHMMLSVNTAKNLVSGDETETSQKATYVQVVTGNRIGKTDGTE